MNKAIVLLAAFVSCQSISDKDALEQWNEFQLKFKKNYIPPSENGRRFGIFRQNLEKIEAHNDLYKQGLVTYEQGVTKFTDWKEEEFLQYVNKYQIEPSKIGNEIFEANSTKTVPDSIDWREFGAVREVKDQGQCDSGWSFSATGALEALAFLKKGLNVSFSEQNLLDCSNLTYGNHGCSGGTMHLAFNYVSTKGIDTEINQPYKGVEGTCELAPSDSFKIRSYIGITGNEASLKEAVGTVGPITVYIDATSNLQNYRSGVFYDASCTDKINQGVLVVGYGTTNGQDYWLIKNSWGESWGESGYLRLARNAGNDCGVAKVATYPTL